MSEPGTVFIVRADTQVLGVRLDIRNVEDESGIIRAPAYDAEREAALVFDALMQLPLETRRALDRILSESCGGWVKASEKMRPQVYPNHGRPER